MTFSEALEELKKGKKIKRSFWGGYWKITWFTPLFAPHHDDDFSMIVAKLVDGTYAPAMPYQTDLLADDWEVVE